jgi:hypothetical protein
MKKFGIGAKQWGKSEELPSSFKPTRDFDGFDFFDFLNTFDFLRSSLRVFQ